MTGRRRPLGCRLECFGSPVPLLWTGVPTPSTPVDRQVPLPIFRCPGNASCCARVFPDHPDHQEESGFRSCSPSVGATSDAVFWRARSADFGDCADSTSITAGLSDCTRVAAGFGHCAGSGDRRKGASKWRGAIHTGLTISAKTSRRSKGQRSHQAIAQATGRAYRVPGSRGERRGRAGRRRARQRRRRHAGG